MTAVGKGLNTIREPIKVFYEFSGEVPFGMKMIG